MHQPSGVMEYKCPCCGAGLHFSDGTQRMTCQYCDNEFDLDTVKDFNESLQQQDSVEFTQPDTSHAQLSEEEQAQMQGFVCPSCGGELVSDENTAATFCPYCGNPSIMPGRVSGGLMEGFPQ